MKKLVIVVFTICTFLSVKGQEQYRVYFTDKGENTELINQPFKFLSSEAIQRRAEHNIPVNYSDLPVSRSYIQQLNLKPQKKSKWLNYVLVNTSNNKINEISSYPFVKKVEKVKPAIKHFTDYTVSGTTANVNYGLAANQIQLHNGQELHQNDYLGQGMVIAVLDGGFSGTQSESAFDSLWLNNRILGTYDFVQGDTNIFDQGSHGTKVLSVLGGYIENGLAGSAPRASYWLFKSEDESKEIASEMDNWVEAAEYADSVGVDIITSSLGYNTFDQGIGDYQYSDMDGNTTIITKAADKAASKGILVINSAGNEGNSSWGFILAPADGDSVLSVGAIDGNRNYASYSSTGPTVDGRIKPDVVAQGTNTIIVGVGGQAVPGQGTSFSCPIISGLAACLWQINPTLSNMEIYEIIRESSHQHFAPDNLLGFGIPNFAAAMYTISSNEEQAVQKGVLFEVYPNPATNGEVYLRSINLNTDTEAELTLFNIKGARVFSSKVTLSNQNDQLLPLPKEKGTYILSIKTSDQVHLEKIIK